MLTLLLRTFQWASQERTVHKILDPAVDIRRMVAQFQQRLARKEPRRLKQKLQTMI